MRLVQMEEAVACGAVVLLRHTSHLPRLLLLETGASVHTELGLAESLVRGWALSSDMGHILRHHPQAGSAEEQAVVLEVHLWTFEI